MSKLEGRGREAGGDCFCSPKTGLNQFLGEEEGEASLIENSRGLELGCRPCAVIRTGVPFLPGICGHKLLKLSPQLGPLASLGPAASVHLPLLWGLFDS